MVVDECYKRINVVTATSADGAIGKASDLCLWPQYSVFSNDCCTHSFAFALYTHVSGCEPVLFCRGSSRMFHQVTELSQPMILSVKILALKTSTSPESDFDHQV